MTETFRHCTVLPTTSLHYLNVHAGGLYVDGTLGGGGHSELILQALNGQGTLFGIDRDPEAIAAAKKRLHPYGNSFQAIQGSFGDMAALLAPLGVTAVDGVLLDLGVSSHQLDTPERGFSFRVDGPLDMRMDTLQVLTAADLIQEASEQELARIFTTYGEERWAKRIAAHICRSRQEAPIETTAQLADIVRGAIPRRFHEDRIDPATRTFQALRIAVNRELEQIETGVKAGLHMLKPGGRMVVISFHSLEDRLVKSLFREMTKGCICPPKMPVCQCGKTPAGKILTGRPVCADIQETTQNPRARSAKLRAFERL